MLAYKVITIKENMLKKKIEKTMILNAKDTPKMSRKQSSVPEKTIATRNSVNMALLWSFLSGTSTFVESISILSECEY